MQQYRKNLGKVSLTAEGAWNRNKEYEILSIVYDENTNHAFVSRKDIPKGVDLYNKKYWMPFNVSGYADNNIILLSQKTSESSIESYTLEEAIKTVASVGRRPGAILGFYNANSNRLDIGGRWEIWQYNGTDTADWENVNNWNNIYYNYNKFIGWYSSEKLIKQYFPFPEIGCYAYVGNNLNEAVLYRCDEKYVWTNTGEHVWNYIKVIVGGNVSIGENGNWFNNGVDTNIPASIKGENGKTPIIRNNNNILEASYDNITWFKISDEIAAWFRWQIQDEQQANSIGKIQITRDGITWTDLSGKFVNNLYISKYIGADESLPTSNIAEGTIYAKGPYYKDTDNLKEHPAYRIWVYAWKDNTLDWQDNGEFTSIAAGIVQETGDSETEVMSQKATTKKITELATESISGINTINSKVDGIVSHLISFDGSSHSSEKDLLYIYIPSGTSFDVKVVEENGQPDGNYGLYLRTKDSSELVTIYEVDKYYTIKRDYDITSIGLYKELTTSGNVRIMLNFNTSILERVNSIESDLYDNNKKTSNLYSLAFGELSNTITLKSEYHSSNDDKVPVSFSSGDSFKIKFNAISGVTSTSIQLFMRNNSDVIDSPVLNVGVEKYYVVPSEIDSIGVYFEGNIGGQAELLLYDIKTLSNNTFKDVDSLKTIIPTKSNKEFYVNSKTSHSSKLDRLFFNINKGDVLYLSCISNRTISKEAAIYGYLGTGEGVHITNLTPSVSDKIIEVVSTGRFDSIGMYYDNSSDEQPVTFNLSIRDYIRIATEALSTVRPTNLMKKYATVEGNDMTFVGISIEDKVVNGSKVRITIDAGDGITFPSNNVSGYTFYEIRAILSSNGNAKNIKRVTNTETNTLQGLIVEEFTVWEDLSTIAVNGRWPVGVSVPISIEVSSNMELINEENYDTYLLTQFDFSQGNMYAGTETSSSTWIRSKYIPCMSLNVVKFWGSNISTWKARYNFFDKNKKIIEPQNFDDWWSLSEYKAVPKGAYYFRVVFRNYDSEGNDSTLTPEDIDIHDIRTSRSVMWDMLSFGVDGGISYYDDSAESRVLAASMCPTAPYVKKQGLLPTFMITTDQHADWERLKRACDFAENISVVDLNVALGDFGDNPDQFRKFDYESFCLGYKKPILNVAGNHEFWYNGGFSESEITEKLWSETLKSHNGDIHPDGKNYWHKDITKTIKGIDYTLRVIAPYEYECPVQKVDGKYPTNWAKAGIYYTQEQIDWFIGLLDSAGENTHVVVLMHYPPCTLVRDDNTWNDVAAPTILTNESYNYASDEFFLIKIIDAWIKGGSVNYEVSFVPPFDESLSTKVVVNHTFASHENRFGGILHGHTHVDSIAHPTGYENIKCIGFITTCSDEGQNGQNDTPRLTDGRTQDAVTVVSYNFFKNTFRLVRLGSVNTSAMIKRECLII